MHNQIRTSLILTMTALALVLPSTAPSAAAGPKLNLLYDASITLAAADASYQVAAIIDVPANAKTLQVTFSTDAQQAGAWMTSGRKSNEDCFSVYCITFHPPLAGIGSTTGGAIYDLMPSPIGLWAGHAPQAGSLHSATFSFTAPAGKQAVVWVEAMGTNIAVHVTVTAQ